MQFMLLFMYTCTKSILQVVAYSTSSIEVQSMNLHRTVFLIALTQASAFSCDIKWVKVAAEGHGGMGEQSTRKYTSLGKAVTRGNTMQVKGNTLHPFSVSTPWAVQNEFTAPNVCSLSFLSVYSSFQYEHLTKGIADFLGFFSLSGTRHKKIKC